VNVAKLREGEVVKWRRFPLQCHFSSLIPVYKAKAYFSASAMLISESQSAAISDTG
jgi:hypothetical protein